MDDFIGVYNNAFNDEYCESIIQLFEQFNLNNRCFKRNSEDNRTGVHKDDTAINFNTHNAPVEFSKFFEKFWEVYYTNYTDQFKLLNRFPPHNIQTLKIQKTLPKQGYHLWHAENEHFSNCKDRILVWILYLNDVEEGGETEFLYFSKRIKPEKGTLLIFPAYFTHTHRGNPPLSGEKYIMTGWVEV